MNLVTSCPDCGTTFNIRPEHLAAHRGDVRCGKCGFIFNALDHLAEAALQEEHAADAPAASAAEIPDAVPDSTAAQEITVAGAETFRIIEFAPPAELPEAVEPAAADTDSALAPEPDAAVAPSAETDISAKPAEIEEITLTSAQAPFHRPMMQPQTLSQSAPEPVRQVSPWLLGAFGLLLLLLCLGQAAYFMRTDIAVHYPPAKPWLAQLCELLGCTVDLPRHASLLAIDDSDLQQDNEHDNVILLTTTLINHAGYAQAYPALELTLTDMNDQPLLRRLFTPSEYLAQGADLAAGLPAGGEARVRLHLATQGVQAAGYRLYVTYP